MKIWMAVVAAVVLLVFVMTFGYVNVHPMDVAVVVNKAAGKVEPQPLGVGYHFYNRWATDMVVYRVAARAFPPDTVSNEESKKYNLELKTNDGQNVSVDLTMIYALRANEVPALHQQIGPNYEDQILLPQVRSEARLVIGGFSAEEIYQGKVRDTIQLSIKERLIKTLDQYPAIQIHDALIRHFAFSGDFEKAIEQKKLAAQSVEINKNLALAQEQEALRVEAEARGNKLRVIQAAEGEAAAKKVNADAERYRLEQEAAGKLAIFKAEAEGKRLSAEALGGGQNVVALKFAENIPDKLQIWGIPTGANSSSLMDLSGMFGKMFQSREESK
jgi:regulator of protease activity HflC (stomatin/prohibitin superfamily)